MKARGTGDLVGRAHELAVMRAAIEGAGSGPAPLVVVHGEDGIGKTAAVAEFARIAERGDAVVLWGTCYQGGVAHPYGPWAEALAGYVERTGTAQLDPEAADVLARLVPAVAGEPRRAAPTLPPDQARLRLYDAVAELLRSIDGTPVVVLDDIHWADADTLELLVHIARFAPNAPIVAVYRGTELDLGQPVTRQLAEICRLRSCEYLLLSRLTFADGKALAERVAGRPLADDVIRALYAESGGNPFFLGELGRHLDARGRGPWRPPETVRQAVALRLAALSRQARDVIEVASVCTAGFSFEELGALAQIDEDALLDCLDEALAAELFRPLEGERYDFCHALVRHTVYERFSASRQARLHRRLAEVLEHLHAGRLEEVAVELARQYQASATLPGAERGVPHALAAAAQARAASAPSEAEACLNVALELAPEDDAAVRAQILGRLALAQAELARFDEAPRTLELALDEMERSGASPQSIAETVCEVVSTQLDALASHAALEAPIARALERLGDAHSLTWARLKLLERPTELVPAGAVHAARWRGFDREAVRIARERGSDADYARTIDHLAPLPLAGIEELAPRVLSWRDPVAQLRGLIVLAWHGTLMCSMGPTPLAERLVEQIDALGDELHMLPAQAMGPLFRAAIVGVTGDFAAAEASFAVAEPLVARLPAEHRVALLAALLRALTREHVEPDWPQMAKLTVEVATSRSQVPWYGLAWAAIACHAYARAEMTADARGLLADIVPAVIASDPWDYVHNGAVAHAAETIWALRDAELAERLLPAALALIRAEVGDYYMTSNELTAARLCAVLGRSDEAVAHFQRARASTEEDGRLPLRAIIDHDEAVARLAAGRPGAAPLLARARSRFAALGMAVWVRRSATVEGVDRLPDGLTPREVEILRRLAAGQTNKEIAADLVVSVHTVERHVQNAYRKISVRNRADATAYVVRAGL